MTIYSIDDVKPELPNEGALFWVAPDANVIGRVRVGPLVSIWFGATIRGDNDPVDIGSGTNIQENAILHTDHGFPLSVGKNCTIGHRAILHGCTIDSGVLIGMGATVLNGARIGKNSLVGACALVPENREIPDETLAIGVPAKIVRRLSKSEIVANAQIAKHYQDNVTRYINSLTVTDSLANLPKNAEMTIV